VLGTERHESRRIDNQLRGRSGRQGDPGESRFYLSLGDDLMRRVGGSTVEAMMTRLRVPDDMPIGHKFVSKAIKSAQTQVEQQNFEIRKNVLKYDEVMNKQRTVIYEERRRVLDGEDLHEQTGRMIDDVVSAYITNATAIGFAEDWDTETLWTALKTLYPITVTPDSIAEEYGSLTAETLQAAVLADVHRAWKAREDELGPEILRELERRVLLSVLDRKWREHLYEMDYLKEGIGLRAMAQRDPLVEYQREGFDMFSAMLDSLKEEAVGYLFNLRVQVVPNEQQQADGAPAPDTAATDAGAAAGQGGKKKVRARMKPVAALPTQQAEAARAAEAKAEAQAAPAALRAKGLEAPAQSAASFTYSGPGEANSSGGQAKNTARTGTVTATKEPGRNDPCPCGSGKKYKQCHGRPTGAVAG
jgi:preprotein translocase subunit SecA